MNKILFKSAIRVLLKEKQSTLLSIGGLGLALCACFLMMQFVAQEYSYDDLIPDVDNKYRLKLTTIDEGSSKNTYATNFYPLGPVIKAEVPEVIDYNRFYYLDRHAIVSIGQENFYQMDVLFSDMNFFDFHGFEVLEFTIEPTQSNGAFLSEELAKKYFGNENPLSKEIRVTSEDGEHIFLVEGIFKSATARHHLNPQMVLPIARLEAHPSYQRNKWLWEFFGTYLQLDEGVQQSVITGKLNNVYQKHHPDTEFLKNSAVALQPVNDIYLESGLLYDYAKTGSQVITDYMLYAAILILILAYINYLNISNVRNSLRTKEIGIKKILGAGKKQVVAQLTIESLVLNIVAVVVGMTLSQTLTPILNGLGIVNLESSLLQHPIFWPMVVLLIISGTLLSSLPQAILLIKQNTREAIKGTKKPRSTSPLRKALVIVQFAISLVMVSGVIVMQSQLNYLVKKDKGIDLNEVLVIYGPRASQMTDEGHQQLINSLGAIPGVRSVSPSSSVPGIWMGKTAISKPEHSAIQEVAKVYSAHHDFLECYEMQLVAGRKFNKNEQGQSILINEMAVRNMGFTDAQGAIGASLIIRGNTYSVVGVVGDYHHFNLKEPITPLVIAPLSRNPEFYSLRLSGSGASINDRLEQMAALWQTAYPSDPFEYFFQTDLFNREHEYQSKVISAFSMFAGLALLIATIGLIGLAAFLANQKIKEIGIRKVLGASVTSILTLFSSGFLKLVIFGILIGSPVFYLGMNEWLNNYAYRIEFPWLVIPATGFFLIVMTITVVTFQTIKTARLNPVESLKYE
ncbi:MAG: ABC transporter permease [Cyclobacteriaceae bacterium]